MMSRRIAFLLLLLSLAACVPVSPSGSHTVTLIADGETRIVTTDVLTVRDLLAVLLCRLLVNPVLVRLLLL